MPHDTTPLKTCTKCGDTKPATTEYFAREERRRDGLQVHCKACQRAYRNANRERAIEYKQSWYAANKERLTPDRHAYREANKGRESDRARSYREANRERIRERKRAYHEANKERDNERARARRAANPEYRRAYAAANPDVIRASHLRRRARKLNAEGTHTAADIQAQYDRQKGRCYYCKRKVGDTYHVDHIVPLARGGSNWPENIAIACPTCNQSKRDRLPHEWSQGSRLL